MEDTARLAVPAADEMSDEEVVRRVQAGETALFEIIMRRYNQRLFRVSRSIVKDSDEAESVMQDAYVSAYMHLGQFAGRARFSTWLTRIAVHEALGRLRRGKRFVSLDSLLESPRTQEENMVAQGRSPEREVLDRELKVVLEGALDGLPRIYRSILVLRDIEGMDTEEAAECLGISPDAVKVRLHRARRLMRSRLAARSGAVMKEAFPFHLERCDRVVAAVFRRIRREP